MDRFPDFRHAIVHDVGRQIAQIGEIEHLGLDGDRHLLPQQELALPIDLVLRHLVLVRREGLIDRAEQIAGEDHFVADPRDNAGRFEFARRTTMRVHASDLRNALGPVTLCEPRWRRGRLLVPVRRRQLPVRRCGNGTG